VFNSSFKAADKPLIDRLFPQVRLSTVSGSVIRDTRKPDAVDPAEGGLIAWTASLRRGAIGSEVGFLKTSPAGIYVPPRGQQQTIAASARGRHGDSFSAPSPRSLTARPSRRR